VVGCGEERDGTELQAAERLCQSLRQAGRREGRGEPVTGMQAAMRCGQALAGEPEAV